MAEKDPQVVPRFFTRNVADPIATERDGRPRFREQEIVEYLIPGDKHNQPHHRVTPEIIAKWPDQYKRFKEGLEQLEDGTSLESWGRLDRIQIAELNALNIVTVEQLAALSDASLQAVGMGARTLRAQALAYCETASDVKSAEKFAERAIRAEQREAELDKKYDAVTAKLNRMSAALEIAGISSEQREAIDKLLSEGGDDDDDELKPTGQTSDEKTKAIEDKVRPAAEKKNEAAKNLKKARAAKTAKAKKAEPAE